MCVYVVRFDFVCVPALINPLPTCVITCSSLMCHICSQFSPPSYCVHMPACFLMFSARFLCSFVFSIPAFLISSSSWLWITWTDVWLFLPDPSWHLAWVKLLLLTEPGDPDSASSLSPLKHGLPIEDLHFLTLCQPSVTLSVDWRPLPAYWLQKLSDDSVPLLNH